MAYVAILADLLMIAASSGAAIYCLILSRRLSRLTSFDKGIGGAIAVLSAQVDEMKAAVAEARAGADGVSHQLQDQMKQARDISKELELMIAACHDFAEEAMFVQAAPSPAANGKTPPPPEPVTAFSERGHDLPPEIAPEEPSAPPPATLAEGAIPQLVFGSRRAATGQPVFVRHGQG